MSRQQIMYKTAAKKLSQIFEGDLSKLHQRDLNLIKTQLLAIVTKIEQFNKIERNEILISLFGIIRPHLSVWLEETEPPKDHITSLIETLDDQIYRDHTKEQIPKSKISTKHIKKWKEKFLLNAANAIHQFQEKLNSGIFNGHKNIENFRSQVERFSTQLQNAIIFLDQYIKRYPETSTNHPAKVYLNDVERDRE